MAIVQSSLTPLKFRGTELRNTLRRRSTMSFTVPSRVNIHLAMAFLLVGSVSAAAQQNGPLFSTPASRSTTGAPILNDPNKQSGTILPNTTGRPVQNTPRQQKQSIAPVSAATQSGAKYKN